MRLTTFLQALSVSIVRNEQYCQRLCPAIKQVVFIVYNEIIIYHTRRIPWGTFLCFVKKDNARMILALVQSERSNQKSLKLLSLQLI